MALLDHDYDYGKKVKKLEGSLPVLQGLYRLQIQLCYQEEEGIGKQMRVEATRNQAYTHYVLPATNTHKLIMYIFFYFVNTHTHTLRHIDI